MLFHAYSSYLYHIVYTVSPPLLPTSTLSSYNSYHTSLKLLHYFDSLPLELKSTIPNSTLSDWKNQNLSKIIGADMLPGDDILISRFAKNAKMKKAAKALFILSDTIVSLFKNVENKAEILRTNKSLILSTIKKTQPVLGSKRVLKMLGLSASKMYYWLEKKNCQNSIFKLCQPRHPHQLLVSEVIIIKKYLLDEKFKNWSSLSIYYQAMRDKAVFMGLGTWYKYAKRLGIKRGFFKLKRKHDVGIRASKPLEILHMDITIFRTLDNTKIYIYFIVDNFSRAILNWKASTEYASATALNVLKGAIQKYGIKHKSTLITDGGSENHGEVLKFIDSSDHITKLIAQKDIIQSNSMVEAINKHMKYYYLFKKHIKDITALINCLIFSVADYNNKPHGSIYGFTPNEVVNGEIPDNSVYQNSKIEAKKQRLLLNQITKCCER